LPELNRVYESKNGQFTFLGIAVDQQMDPAGHYHQNGFSFTLGYDDNGAKTYGVSGIPTTLFIDRQGNLVDKVTGGMGASDFDAKLAKIL
jgi:hypothetical protein